MPDIRGKDALNHAIGVTGDLKAHYNKLKGKSNMRFPYNGKADCQRYGIMIDFNCSYL